MDLVAAILAGGFGTRLQSVVHDRPKVLAEVNGRPFITFLLDRVRRHGIKKTILCTGFRANQIQELLGDEYNGMQLLYSQETHPLGTAGALRLALGLMDTPQVLVMNGDSICDADLSLFWQWHLEKPSGASIELVHLDSIRRYGSIEIDANDRILRFNEKMETGIPGWVNAGIYLLPAGWIREIPEERMVSIEKDIFPKWIGRDFYGHRTHGKFIDIGTPESYQESAFFFNPCGA